MAPVAVQIEAHCVILSRSLRQPRLVVVRVIAPGGGERAERQAGEPVSSPVLLVFGAHRRADRTAIDAVLGQPCMCFRAVLRHVWGMQLDDLPPGLDLAEHELTFPLRTLSSTVICPLEIGPG